MSEFKGYTDGHQFRIANQYTDTQKLFETLGLTDAVESRTPTVGVNVAHLARMDAVQQLSMNVKEKERVNTTILGISTAEGPGDFEKLLHGLGAKHVVTTAIDISDGIFERIEQWGLDEVACLQRDARETGLADATQQIVLRDHIGNCCPPDIDRGIDQEAARILEEGRIAIVNITTSDLLPLSPGRASVSFAQLQNLIPQEMLQALQTSIYDLDEVRQLFPQISFDDMRGKIIEIEPGGSFVVFGEDAQGHGEWFRRLDDHKATWEQHGFEVVEIATREGTDSHNPPLQCMRHNVVLRKKITSSKK